LTGNDLKPVIVHMIADRCPNVVGLKDSCGVLAQVIDSATARGGKFNIAIGSNGLLLSAAVAGIPAGISGNPNAVPECFVEFYNAYWRGDLAAAQAAQTRIQHARRTLEDGGDLSLFKAILIYRGISAGASGHRC
jgi:dihydrodipicolinate synthase/N-acetylneuraminate lyase